MKFSVLALHGLSFADRSSRTHVLRDTAHSGSDVTADFEVWCGDAVSLIQGKVAVQADALNKTRASVAEASQEVKTIDGQYAKLRREALPQPGQTGLDAAVGAMVRSASPEQQLLHQSKVTAGVTQARVQTAYHDARVLGSLLGGLLRTVNKACYQARNFDAEVKEALRPTPPPFVFAKTSPTVRQRPPGRSDSALSLGKGALRLAASADPMSADPQGAAVGALVARREALKQQEEHCAALRTGAEAIAAAKAGAAATLARAAEQHAARAKATSALKDSFEALAAELADSQAAVETIFAAELSRYSKAASEAASEEDDAGHRLWAAWREDLDHGFEKLRKFLALRHGLLAATAEGHKETATPPHAAFRKTDPPEGAHCRSATELQAELDKLDAQIDEVTATSFA